MCRADRPGRDASVSRVPRSVPRRVPRSVPPHKGTQRPLGSSLEAASGFSFLPFSLLALLPGARAGGVGLGRLTAWGTSPSVKWGRAGNKKLGRNPGVGSGEREGPGRDQGRGGGWGRAQKCPPLPKLGLWGPAHRGQVHQVTRHTQPEFWQKQTGHLLPTAPTRKRPQMSRWRRSPRAPTRSARERNGPEEPSGKPHPALAAASLRPLLRPWKMVRSRRWRWKTRGVRSRLLRERRRTLH